MSTVIKHLNEFDFVQNMLFLVTRNSELTVSYQAASCDDIVTETLNDKFGGIAGDALFLFAAEDSIISVYDYIKKKNPHFRNDHPYLQDIYKKIFIIDTDFNYEYTEEKSNNYSCKNEVDVVNPKIIKMYLDKYSEFNKKEENLDITMYDFETEEGTVRFTFIRDFTLFYEDGIAGDIITTWTYPDIYIEYEN